MLIFKGTFYKWNTAHTLIIAPSKEDAHALLCKEIDRYLGSVGEDGPDNRKAVIDSIEITEVDSETPSCEILCFDLSVV